MSKKKHLFPAFFKNVFGKSSHHVLPSSYVDVFMHLVHVSGVVAYVGSVGFVSSDTMAIDDRDNSFIKNEQLFVYGRTVSALPFYEVKMIILNDELKVGLTNTDDNTLNANDTLLLVFVQLAIVHLVLELVRLVSLPQLVERGDDGFFLQEVLGDVVTLAIGLVDFKDETTSLEHFFPGKT